MSPSLFVKLIAQACRKCKGADNSPVAQVIDEMRDQASVLFRKRFSYLVNREEVELLESVFQQGYYEACSRENAEANRRIIKRCERKVRGSAGPFVRGRAKITGSDATSPARPGIPT